MYLSGILKYIIMKGVGLTIKNGRLINNRPVAETGIAEASRLRQQVRHQNKVSTIADGIVQAEMRKDMFKLM